MLLSVIQLADSSPEESLLSVCGDHFHIICQLCDCATISKHILR